MAEKLFYSIKYKLTGEASKLEALLFIFLFAAFFIFIVSVPNKQYAIIEPASAPSAQVAINEPAKTPDERFKYLGWWGNINYGKAGVYKKPTRNSEKLGTFLTDIRVKVLEESAGELVGTNNLWYRIDGGMYPGAYVFSADVTPVNEPEPPVRPKIPASAKEGDYWVDVDLTKRVLTLFQYEKPVFATYVAIGVYTHPTLPGTYRVWYKIEKARMRGRPPTAARVYNLPNVPYIMYYRGSYSLHGTYWHDKFGSRQSSGCTNLTQGDAKYIFQFIKPGIAPETAQYAFSSPDNPGTLIYNHY